jgi:hypothetical protein
MNLYTNSNAGNSASIVEREIIQPQQQLYHTVIRQESPQELKQLSIFDLFENTGETVAVLLRQKTTSSQTDQPEKTNAYRSPARPVQFCNAATLHASCFQWQ